MTAATRFAGVIGWPVAHSYSPAMQEAAFAALGLDWRYGAFAVEPARLEAAVRGAAALGFVGLNVTVPHKEAVLDWCEPDGAARALGAVNTLLFEAGGDRPRGFNTDVHGFGALLDEANVESRRAVVLGAGGAARAAAFHLIEGGAEVTVVSRSARRLRFADGREPRHVPWSDEALAALLPAVDLLVDASPRGLDPASSFDLAPLASTAAVIDLVVRPTTPLVAAARARGLRACTGEAMLLHQGARSFEIWTGQEAPIAVMREALARALRGE